MPLILSYLVWIEPTPKTKKQVLAKTQSWARMVVVNARFCDVCNTPQNLCTLYPAVGQKFPHQSSQGLHTRGSLAATPLPGHFALELNLLQHCRDTRLGNNTDRVKVAGNCLPSLTDAALHVYKIPRLIVCIEHHFRSCGWNPFALRSGPYVDLTMQLPQTVFLTFEKDIINQKVRK